MVGKIYNGLGSIYIVLSEPDNLDDVLVLTDNEDYTGALYYSCDIIDRETLESLDEDNISNFSVYNKVEMFVALFEPDMMFKDWKW